MQGKLFGPPEQRTAAAANTGIDKAGRFRRWLRKNRLPLTGTLTVALAFAGTFAVMETGPGMDSDSVRSACRTQLRSKLRGALGNVLI